MKRSSKNLTYVRYNVYVRTRLGCCKEDTFFRGKGISTEEYFLVGEEDTAYDINSQTFHTDLHIRRRCETFVPFVTETFLRRNLHLFSHVDHGSLFFQIFLFPRRPFGQEATRIPRRNSRRTVSPIDWRVIEREKEIPGKTDGISVFSSGFNNRSSALIRDQKYEKLSSNFEAKSRQWICQQSVKRRRKSIFIATGTLNRLVCYGTDFPTN